MLEREAEMATLEAILAAAREGEGRLVVVEGSAGIGKTRLLARRASSARKHEFQVFAARAGELEGEFAFGIVRQLFEAPLAAATPDMRAELLSGAAGLSASLFASAPTTASRDGAESSFAMLHGLYWLAAEFRLGCALLSLWTTCTGPTSRRCGGSPTSRTDSKGCRFCCFWERGRPNRPTCAVVTELMADPGAIAIRPGSLGEASAATLARERLGAEPDPDFAAALQTGSGGNPLFLSLCSMRSRGSIRPTADQASYVIELGPQAIARGIATRLARLPVEAAQLLRAAATSAIETSCRWRRCWPTWNRRRL